MKYICRGDGYESKAENSPDSDFTFGSVYGIVFYAADRRVCKVWAFYDPVSDHRI